MVLIKKASSIKKLKMERKSFRMSPKSIRSFRSIEVPRAPPAPCPGNRSMYGKAPHVPAPWPGNNAMYGKAPHAPEFPTSPQPVVGEEIVHYSHLKHPLVEVTLQELFTCAGCKEYGAGKRYACQQCEFQLHDFCAFSPPTLKDHPLHGQHQLVFHAKPKQAGITWPRCDVCSKSLKGFVFRCRACNFQMHPCCAMLSHEMKLSVHPHTLKLLPPTINKTSSSADSNPAIVCGECKKKRSGRVYRCSECNDYYLHAICAKAFLNGLQENGIDPPAKPSMISTAARVASQVVIEFIGGFLDGIGEGVGEALVQNIGRGRRNVRRARTNQ